MRGGFLWCSPLRAVCDHGLLCVVVLGSERDLEMGKHEERGRTGYGEWWESR